MTAEEAVARALFAADHGSPSCKCHGFEKERREYTYRARVAIAAYSEWLAAQASAAKGGRS